MERTGTPTSITSTLRFAIYIATVPPPPASTLPSSPLCHKTPFDSRRFLTKLTYSAEASDVPPLPLAPVNLVTQTPSLMNEELFFSKGVDHVGSNAALTSAERHLELERTSLPS